MTRFSGHGICVGCTPLFDALLGLSAQKYAPNGGAAYYRGFLLIRELYSTFSPEIKALRRNKKVSQPCAPATIAAMVNTGTLDGEHGICEKNRNRALAY